MKGNTLIEILVALAIFSTTILGGAFLSLQGIKITRQSLHDTQQIIQVKNDDAPI
ncbi:MAG: prepilin-type N-terminal cleavage/methylation domain-containing protein [Proteobacteria bacterium]|nr:prepilin-type N-terminal cleavage/methylation domain-containing protein [Pseudomonadota bacterium]